MPTKYRLLGVGQVRIEDGLGAVSHDLRCDIAEITRGDGLTMVTLYSVLDRAGETTAPRSEPLLVARLVVRGSVRITDPAAGDYLTWSLSSDTLEMEIRPYRNESISLDRTFAEAPIDAEVRLLYDQLRVCRHSLTINTRILNQTPPEQTDLRRLGSALCEQIAATVQQLEHAIAEKEPKAHAEDDDV